MQISRRTAIQAVAGVAAIGTGATRAQTAAGRLKLAKGLGDLADKTIRFFLQMGVEYVVMPTRFNTQVSKRGLVPPTDNGPAPDEILKPWDAGELITIRKHLESRGLRPEMVHLGRFTQILLGKTRAEEELDNVKQSIRAAGKAGIPVVEYNSTPLRGSEGYAQTTGRGNAALRDFDFERVKDLPPLPNVGQHTREQLWERLTGFLKEVVPVAEEADVRLAMHPNDPPVPVFRGTSKPS